jgi:hypothetical protein
MNILAMQYLPVTWKQTGAGEDSGSQKKSWYTL